MVVRVGLKVFCKFPVFSGGKGMPILGLDIPGKMCSGASGHTLNVLKYVWWRKKNSNNFISRYVLKPV